MSLIRLDKYLADAGQGTRSEVKIKLKQCRVRVNDTVVKKPETKINPDEDVVSIDGKALFHEEFQYYMLNKPAGVVSATKDERDKTVLQLITEDKRRDLFPVGRLDKDTEGLLLITNDGVLANNLLAPGKHVDKEYYALVEGRVTEETVESFRQGVDIGDDKLTAPAVLIIEESGEESRIRLTITEGRYHQVKRMFEAVGMKVKYLKRLSMGCLKLDETLEVGEYRRLTPEELEELKNK
ncbi:MAG: rRNA pseudouridine synthase [Lachnospiraceae bacterium]|nr:rRNA pseudouridine synthase [Lachnospiraceae bacterium]MBQ9936370.1 rRNA pseudouridine synthase [Lachnospiraceae bacterium]